MNKVGRRGVKMLETEKNGPFPGSTTAYKGHVHVILIYHLYSVHNMHAT